MSRLMLMVPALTIALKPPSFVKYGNWLLVGTYGLNVVVLDGKLGSKPWVNDS